MKNKISYLIPIVVVICFCGLNYLVVKLLNKIFTLGWSGGVIFVAGVISSVLFLVLCYFILARKIEKNNYGFPVIPRK